MRIAYAVLALSLIPAIIVYYRVRESITAHDRIRFERAVREQRLAIEQSVSHCVDAMTGIRGFFTANPSVTAEQWQQYFSGLDLQKSYPGVRAIGYLERVNAGEKSIFLAKPRLHGEPPLRIEPEGERPVYFPMVYVNYSDPHSTGGLGTDQFADPERQSAMEQARDSGYAEATGPVVLRGSRSGETKPNGFVIYLAVYRDGAPTATAYQRRAALEGFIFAAVDSERFFNSAFVEGSGLLGCEIFDGSESGASLVYRNPELSADSASHEFSETMTLPVLNRSWNVHVSSLPAFDAESQKNLPAVALICWLALGLMLFGIAWGEVAAWERSKVMMSGLRKSEAALAAEKERLAVTLYSIGDGVITTDTKGCILSLNKMAEELTGWTQTEALGKPLRELFKIINENTGEACASPLEEALRTGTISNLAQPAVLIARDGKQLTIADSAAPIRDHTGAIVGAVVVFRDVTEKQRLEAELLKESKLESVGLLAGGIAHDFNNVLQGIMGNLSLARMNSHSTERMLERLAALEKSALRAKDLTQQLVMFARGGAPIRKRMQLGGVIKEAALSALTGGNVQCEFALPGDIWSVDVDEGQFRQVINNIVVNAMQAMPDGGKIEVRAENVEFTSGFLPPLTAGKYVKISIHDHGTGIKPEHLSRIFDPYFTTRKHARGLGLASAYSVVRKHEGQISVDSLVGHGTTFHIYLPASVTVVETPTHGPEQKNLFGHGRVLVMDDESEILFVVREMLELMGYEVEVAKDGAEAVQRYIASQRGNQPFSAVIMDLTVPEGMGGKEAIKRLKEFDPNVKAIVSSGYSLDPVMANFREYGFSGVIPKPYVMEDLGRVLGDVITNGAARPAK